ncbi:MAG: hypothetical protein JSV12_01235 [Candidatus Bathyarchaeota archaeon]|nr:MAG: hypothetical protein JSV12_01235 [Candidatus Bathyarchaeota archaeon]
MKGRKSHRRKKTRKGTFKKKPLYGIIFAIIILSIAFIYSTQHSPTNQTTNQTSQLKAAIVDHLSLTVPNQTFIETATNTLKQAGYTVDYYPGEEVNVEFYRNLPTHGYGLIILRVHSSATKAIGIEGPVTLYTSEPYSETKYLGEQLTDQLWPAAYSMEQVEKGIGYFGIGPLFVTRSMKGRFQNTIIIMMGCEGLGNSLMANAFVERGAKVYISWNQEVLASHTDLATTHLLQHFLIEKRTLHEALRETFKEVGFDPVYKSLLFYFPLEVGDQTVEDIISES